MASEAASEDRSIRVRSTEEGPVVRELTVEVDAARVKRAFDAAYRDLGRRVSIPGFRPGKAPRRVLEKRFGASVAEQLEQTLVAETLADAVELSGVEPVTEPAISTRTPSAETGFTYTARLEVKPRFELPDLEGLEAERPPVGVEDDEVERQLEDLRQRHAHQLEEPEQTEAVEGHVATLDFVGRIDGRPFEGGTGRGVDVEIGAGRFLPGFEEQLRGARAGDDREVRVTFPEDYGHPELAGKEAVFSVHVAALKRVEVPELDDEFAKDLEFDTLDALRQRIHDEILAGKARESEAVFQRTLMDSLLARCAFEVPPGLVERQLERQLQAAHRRMESQVPHDALHRQLARWREEWRPEAEREVRERLVLEAVAEAWKIEVEDAEVEGRIEAMAAEQGIERSQLLRALGDDALRDALRAQIRDEQALARLGAEAKVRESTDS